MTCSAIALQKKLKGVDLMRFFSDIPMHYKQKYLKVVVFLDQDLEDEEIANNQKKLKKEM